jgi:polyferredoxin
MFDATLGASSVGEAPLPEVSLDAVQLLLLADIVLAAHTALALFLTFGLAAILTGGPQWRMGGWRFVRNRAFRVAHLLGLAVVAGEALLGVTCPLTEFESALRAAAQTPAYGQSFIAHWLGRILFYDFDERVFASAYLAGLALSAWAWRQWPPRRAKGGGR